MGLSKQYIPPPTGPLSPAESKPDLYHRLASLLPGIVLRPWVQNYMLSRRVQMGIDAVIASASFIFAHLLRFDGWPPGVDNDRVFLVLPYLVAARIGVNYSMGLYRRVWRYVSIPDSIHMTVSVGIISLILLVLRLCLPGIYPLLTVPISIIFVDFMLTTSLMICARLFWRITCENAARAKTQPNGVRLRTLMVGAGDAGIMAAREISRRRDLGMQVCGFIDDEPSKLMTVIQGIPVLGSAADIPAIVRGHRIDQVIITMANARRKTVRRILDLCEEARVPVKIIPGLYEILGNHVTVTNVRPVEIEDLLGRDTIDVEAWLEASQGSYAGKRILVTGAGGSIGRELCRQLATLAPSSVILLDKDENSVFEAERELRQSIGKNNIEIAPVICDLRVTARLQQVFRQFRPQVVFHAAAHKHVPLMESNASEAVLNNIVGTRNLLECAGSFGVERCVMVSTDKAVNPTSIMGATKRVAELLFQSQAVKLSSSLNQNKLNHGEHGEIDWFENPRVPRVPRGSSLYLNVDMIDLDGAKTKAPNYSCVRFGNVLGSRGSVVPIFREQIKNGGPVTVTHPDVERYFMTIPEAAQLIIQAGAIGQRGEIFLLDMGEPVKVFDLAKDMIRLSGFTLGDDIDIEFFGLRAGEKIKEELLILEEGARTTRYEKIFVAPPLEYDFRRLDEYVAELTAVAEDGDDRMIYEIFSSMGIGFQPMRGEIAKHAK